MSQKVNEEEVWESLKAVTDPEIGVDVVNLGLVYGVDIAESGDVHLRLTLTSMGCPATAMMEFMAKEAVGTVEGVGEVTLEWTFDPPWTPERMTEEGREMMMALGFW